MQPFLERRALLLVLCFIALALARIVAAYPENGITFDEPGHMACGLQFLAQHVYKYESQHPPLARLMSALGPYLDGARPMGIANQDQEGVAIMYRGSGSVLRTLVLMRLGMLPFFVLACFVVYWFAARCFGKAIAVLAMALWTLVPPVLAHAGVATTDMPVTACLGLAFYCLLVWAETPGLRQSLALGGATALMALSKFTALAFFPAAAALALIAYLATRRPGRAALQLAKERALPFLIAVLTGAVVIWAGYLFSFGKVPGWNFSLPAPEVFDGVRSALQHNDRGHVAYLLGQISVKGWWYYFPVALAVKTPLGFLFLLPLGVWACWRHRRELALWLPWALVLGVLIPAMMGSVNIGVRHILPVYLGFSVIAALGLRQLLQWRNRWLSVLGGVWFLWIAASGLAEHPDYLGYFNEIAAANPAHYLVDSDLDWGQDTVRLARWLREKNIAEVSFVTMNLSGPQLETWPGFPKVRPVDALRPAEGWTAISPTILIFNQYGLNYRYPNLRPWFEQIPQAGREGPFLLYYVPPGALQK